jgi:hypothetical protein
METTSLSFEDFYQEIIDHLNQETHYVSKQIIAEVLGYKKGNHIYLVLERQTIMHARILYNLLLLIGIDPRQILDRLKECKKFREAEELRKELKTGNKKKKRK